MFSLRSAERLTAMRPGSQLAVMVFGKLAGCDSTIRPFSAPSRCSEDIHTNASGRMTGSVTLIEMTPRNLALSGAHPACVAS